MSIFDAVRHITHFDQYDAWDAEHLIEKGLATGKIRARATDQRAFSQSSLRFHKSGVPEPTPDSEWIDIEPGFWAGAHFECDDWERERGTATIVALEKSGTIALGNLQIDHRDLRKWLENETYITGALSMRGRPRHESKWADVVLDLIELERRGELTEDRFPHENDLIAEFKTEFDEKQNEGRESLDIRTAKGVIRAVWETMVRGNRAKSPTRQ